MLDHAITTRRYSTLTLVLFVSISINVTLGVYAYRHLRPSPSGRIVRPLQIGQQIAPFAARSLDGSPVLVRFERRTVLYVIAPNCQWCAKNTANIHEIWKAAHRTHDVIGLSLSQHNLPRYMQEHPLPFPVLVVDDAIRDRLGLGVTPSTIIVSPAGTVIHRWNGAYVTSGQAVEKYFGISLPVIFRE